MARAAAASSINRRANATLFGIRLSRTERLLDTIIVDLLVKLFALPIVPFVMPKLVNDCQRSELIGRHLDTKLLVEVMQEIVRTACRRGYLGKVVPVVIGVNVDGRRWVSESKCRNRITWIC